MIGELFQPHLRAIENILLLVFREVEFGIGVVMVEDVLDPEQLERQGHQKNIIGGIAALNDVKSTTEINPPGVHKFPEQSPAELPQIPQRTVALGGYRMAVDVYAFQKLIAALVPFALRTQYRDFVAVLMQAASFLPYPTVERDGNVFHDDEDFFAHEVNSLEVISGRVVLIHCWIKAAGRVRPARTALWPVPNAVWVFC